MIKAHKINTEVEKFAVKEVMEFWQADPKRELTMRAGLLTFSPMIQKLISCWMRKGG